TPTGLQLLATAQLSGPLASPPTQVRVMTPDPAVALNWTGELARPVALACATCCPTVGPRVQRAHACPLEFVGTVVMSSEPPPDTTLNVTVTPLMPLPALSVARTTIGLGSVSLTSAPCPLPEEI